MERLTEKRMKGEGFILADPKEYKAFARGEKPTGKQIYQRLLEIEDILGDDYDLDRLRELVEADRDGRCVIVTRCHECENHRDVDGYHYCKFWRMYCPDDSDFYCKAAKPC